MWSCWHVICVFSCLISAFSPDVFQITVVRMSWMKMSYSTLTRCSMIQYLNIACTWKPHVNVDFLGFFRSIYMILLVVGFPKVRWYYPDALIFCAWIFIFGLQKYIFCYLCSHSRYLAPKRPWSKCGSHLSDVLCIRINSRIWFIHRCYFLISRNRYLLWSCFEVYSLLVWMLNPSRVYYIPYNSVTIWINNFLNNLGKRLLKWMCL